MSATLVFVSALRHCVFTAMIVLLDSGRLSPSPSGLAAPLQPRISSSRKQLALFHEGKVKPRLADDSTRLMIATLSRMFEWRGAAVNVKPDTLIRWHGFSADSGSRRTGVCVHIPP